MGALKDLVDLATQLDASIKDRRTRELFLPIKEKLVEVREEQFELRQQHAEEVLALKAEHEAVTTEREQAHAAKVTALGKEIASLRAQLEQQQSADEFVTHEGILWKKKQGGGFDSSAYCPKCREIMHGFPSGGRPDYWICDPCDKTYDGADAPPKPQPEIPAVGRANVRRSL